MTRVRALWPSVDVRRRDVAFLHGGSTSLPRSLLRNTRSAPRVPARGISRDDRRRPSENENKSEKSTREKRETRSNPRVCTHVNDSGGGVRESAAGDDEQEGERGDCEKQRECRRCAKEGGSSEIDSGRARRRRVVGSSRVTSGRAGAAPGSCGVCRRPGGGREGGGWLLLHIHAPLLRAHPVPFAPHTPSSHPVTESLPFSPRPSSRAASSPFFIVPYRHIGSFSNSISLNGIKTILLRALPDAFSRARARAHRSLAAVRFPDRSRVSLARRIWICGPRIFCRFPRFPILNAAPLLTRQRISLTRMSHSAYNELRYVHQFQNYSFNFPVSGGETRASKVQRK